METIKVTVAKFGSCYAASMGSNVPGTVVFTADTYEELQQNASEALRLHVEKMIADGNDVPNWLVNHEYNFEYENLHDFEIWKDRVLSLQGAILATKKTQLIFLKRLYVRYMVCLLVILLIYGNMCAYYTYLADRWYLTVAGIIVILWTFLYVEVYALSRIRDLQDQVKRFTFNT